MNIMKRSEMIVLIQEHVKDAIEVYAGLKKDSSKIFAEKILNNLEKVGMLPPEKILTIRRGMDGPIVGKMFDFTWDAEESEEN